MALQLLQAFRDAAVEFGVAPRLLLDTGVTAVRLSPAGTAEVVVQARPAPGQNCRAADRPASMFVSCSHRTFQQTDRAVPPKARAIEASRAVRRAAKTVRLFSPESPGKLASNSNQGALTLQDCHCRCCRGQWSGRCQRRSVTGWC